MTDRNPDFHCTKCGKYLFSTFPRDPLPKQEELVCKDCKTKEVKPKN